MSAKSVKPKGSPKVNPLLRIGGSDIKLVQFLEYSDTQAPGGQRVVVLNFQTARLADANNSDIFTGQVIVRLRAVLSTAASSIVSRLLQPFKGYFVINVTGTYVIQGGFAEVQADEVSAINIQPTIVALKSKKKQFVEVDGF